MLLSITLNRRTSCFLSRAGWLFTYLKTDLKTAQKRGLIMSNENQEYLAKRQLKRGTAGWILLAVLGVSYVISGDFAGWNFGIAEAGWGGFAIAAV
jgi:hypothetical protein